MIALVAATAKAAASAAAAAAVDDAVVANNRPALFLDPRIHCLPIAVLLIAVGRPK